MNHPAPPQHPAVRTASLSKTYGTGETAVSALIEVDLELASG